MEIHLLEEQVLFRQHLAQLSEGELRAQEINSQSATHAISTLLSWGGSVETAQQMLASLQQSNASIRAECRRRGLEPLAERDQIGEQH